MQLTKAERKKLVGFKNIAYEEYLSARILFQNGRLIIACHLANTCLEKEMKSLLFAHRVATGKLHDTGKLLNLLDHAANSDVVQRINQDFLKVLTKIYECRYFESQGEGFNFVIQRRKFLAELDYTFDLLTKATVLKNVDNSPRNPTKYEIDSKNKLPELFKENYLLHGLTKEQFLNLHDDILEFRIMKDYHLVNDRYKIISNSERNSFLLEGLRPDDGGMFTYRAFPFDEILKDVPDIYQ